MPVGAAANTLPRLGCTKLLGAEGAIGQRLHACLQRVHGALCVFVRNSVHFAVLYDRMQHAIARDQTDDLLCDGSFGLGPKLNRFSSRSWRRSWRVRFIHCDILGGQRAKNATMPNFRFRSRHGDPFRKPVARSRNKEGVTGGNSPYADRAPFAVFSGHTPTIPNGRCQPQKLFGSIRINTPLPLTSE